MSAFLRDVIAKWETLPTVLKQGFKVTYVTAASGSSIGMCLTCKNSGGTCGYYTTTKNSSWESGMSVKCTLHALQGNRFAGEFGDSNAKHEGSQLRDFFEANPRDRM